MFVHVFREYQHLKFDVEQLCSLSWQEFPDCGDQQHSCHVDGNNKLYRYTTTTSGKSVLLSFKVDLSAAQSKTLENI